LSEVLGGFEKLCVCNKRIDFPSNLLQCSSEYVANTAESRMSLNDSVRYYRNEWLVARGFHSQRLAVTVVICSIGFFSALTHAIIAGQANRFEGVKLSAELKGAAAQFELGLMYAHGEGVPKESIYPCTDSYASSLRWCLPVDTVR
jgi:TPR repeat protein